MNLFAVITNMPAIKNYHNSASTAISIPSTLEYDGKFYLPTQDSSSISSISFSSSDLYMFHLEILQNQTGRDAFYIRPIRFRRVLQLPLLHLFTIKKIKTTG